MRDQIAFIWPWEWRTGKVLYLITRYGVFIDLIMFHTFWFKPGLDPKGCERLFNAGSWTLNVGITVAQWIIVMRTYAIWNHAKIVLFTLVLFALGTDIPTFFVLHDLLKNLKWSASPFPSIAKCVVTIPPNKLYMNFTMNMILELAIIILTVWRAVSQRKTIRIASGLLGILYRDGVLFFACIFVTSLANFSLQVNTNLPALYIFLLPELQRVLHSVLTSKIILHLREYTLSTPVYGSSTSIFTSLCHQEMSSMRFQQEMSANGAAIGVAACTSGSSDDFELGSRI